MRAITTILLGCFLASCTQSLFDSHGKKPTDTINRGLCPEECEGDLVADFDTNQGGTTGRWHYRDDKLTRAWDDMTLGAYESLTAMVGGGDPVAHIVSCKDEDSGLCANDPDTMVFMTGASGSFEPSTEFTVADQDVYTVSGVYRVVSPGSPHMLRIYRNTRDDLVYAEEIDTDDTEVHEFSVIVEALAGDRLLFVIGATGETGAAISVLQFVSRDVTQTARCEMAVTFDAHTNELFPDFCAGGNYTGYRDGVTGTSPPDDDGTFEALTAPDLIDSVIPELGDAMQFAHGDYLEPPQGALDYSNAVTVQMWMAFPNGYNLNNAGRAFSDVNDLADKGIEVIPTTFGRVDSYIALGGPDFVETFDQLPDDMGWHHYRFVRSEDGETVYTCVDGVQVYSTPTPSTANATSDRRPALGRNMNQGFAYFRGALDDVRVFSRALPCSQP